MSGTRARFPPVQQVSAAHVALGRAVRALRIERGLSQEELGERSGMHRTYVGGIERGERNLSYANIVRLARALDLAPSELLRRAEEDLTAGLP
jgi:transcriptional regulator with XRE-family HTH domain